MKNTKSQSGQYHPIIIARGLKLLSIALLISTQLLARQYDLRAIAEFNLGVPLGQLRAVPVSLGSDRAIAVLYSEERGVDPWEGMFFFPKNTLKLAVFSTDGLKLLWKKDLGEGVVPGIWFSPLFAFDLDQDGKDELWIVNNRDPKHPLNFAHYILQKLHPETGEVMAEIPWPKPEVPQLMSYLYRHFIMGGYVNGEPVLLTAQGTYGPMRIQAWNKDLSKRWEYYISKDTPGASGSHVSPVVDINNDGVDELLWGERAIELDKGKQLFCADEDSWEGHSDVIQPIFNYADNSWVIFTCREARTNQYPRVVMFDQGGNRIWADLEIGHMDTGWAARLGDQGEPYVLAVRIGQKAISADEATRMNVEEFTYEAYSGKKVNLGFDTYTTIPVDLDGDGIHELVRGYFEGDGSVLDRKGNQIGNIGGLSAMASKFMDLPGEQILSYSEDGWIRIWADKNAKDSPNAILRYNHPAYKTNSNQTGNGSNLFNLGGI